MNALLSIFKSLYINKCLNNHFVLVIIIVIFLFDQLQDLQSSTKKVLSEQEEAHRNEKKSLQLVNSDLLE